MGTQETNERERVLELVRRHGFNTTSFQALEEGLRYRFDEHCDACTAYADAGRAWVAAGAPIAAERDLDAVAQRFVAAGRARGMRVSFFASQERFVGRAGLVSVPVGLQPVWDPRDWTEALAKRSSLRAQLNRAANKGVSVRRLDTAELLDESARVRVAIDGLIARWRAMRRMSPLGFLVSVEPFSFAAERRSFVAEQDGRVVGFLSAVPVYARDGWFLEDVLRESSAPNGTIELLVDAAMRQALAENSAFVTLGLAPLAGPVPAWMRRLGRIGRPLYDFAGLHAFKSRLAPTAWEPVYVAHTPDVPSSLAVLDALRAFAGGSLAAFAVRTFLSGPGVVLWILAALLVPWTVLLAVLPTSPWFPSRAVHVAWVAFDVVLLVALTTLCLRFRRRLAFALAIAISADALLTWIQVAAWNAPRIASVLEACATAIGCAGPTLAAVMLWTRLARTRPAAQPPPPPV